MMQKRFWRDVARTHLRSQWISGKHIRSEQGEIMNNWACKTGRFTWKDLASTSWCEESSNHIDEFILFQDDTIRVASDLPFLHAQEREELESLCQIASYYLRFKNFIKRYKKFSLRPAIPPPTPASSEEEGLVPGLYVRSFAYGLEETLTPYNHLILALEQVSAAKTHISIHVWIWVQKIFALTDLEGQYCASVFSKICYNQWKTDFFGGPNVSSVSSFRNEVSDIC